VPYKKIEEETVPCKICGTPTTFTGTELCNRCWELKSRIEMYPELARKILEDFEDTIATKKNQN
jgi:hypothetical protein